MAEVLGSLKGANEESDVNRALAVVGESGSWWLSGELRLGSGGPAISGRRPAAWLEGLAAVWVLD